MNLKDLSFTREWSLFLDRDGVISLRIMDGYVTTWEDFHFIDGVLDAMADLSRIFGHIFIVSNQQGVGKGRMSAESLKKIDNLMKQEITRRRGRIDASYYSPYLESENHPDRKPGTGMGLKAKSEFPSVDFSRSVMVGDSESDIEFGKKLGMITVLISDEEKLTGLADFRFRSLIDFSIELKSEINRRP
ncbi:MAG: HAD-IIIA family hydrolase [Bacteroidales bacterium]|jgi:histidinol-phosphate phosphatase family protein|nr:HAD-IIIA family hydrolase [Bacteroidales bacterium]